MITTQTLIWIAAILGGLAIFVIVYTLARPQTRGKRTVAKRDRIPDGNPLAGMAYRVAVGYQDETGNLEQLLKAANWFWAPGELEPPDPSAPFYSARGYHAACIYQALLYGVLGLLASTTLSLLLEAPFLLAVIIAVLAALAGYTGPAAQLQSAVQQRQHRMTVEMAFRLPELASVVSTGRSLTQALRELTSRPGGPFITEIARLLRTYDVTTSFEAAVGATISHNDFAPLTEFLQQLQLVESRGGSLTPALRVQARAAQERLRRRMIEQGVQNASRMELPVVVGSIVVTMGLVAGPALWMFFVYI